VFFKCHWFFKSGSALSVTGTLEVELV
jgi:hypothetical protein